MGRPRGAKNKPGYVKPGPKSGLSRYNRMSPDTVLHYKGKILDLLCTGQARTYTEAAEKLGVTPAKVHAWALWDKDFQEALHLAKEIVADKLETKLTDHANFIPQMMILKGLRPIYRDNYKIDLQDSRTKELLEELRAVIVPKLPEGPTVEVVEVKEEHGLQEPGR